MLLWRRACGAKIRLPFRRQLCDHTQHGPVVGCLGGHPECEGPSRHEVQKPGPNFGRSFQSCSRQEDGCNHFQWLDDRGQGPDCHCGEPSISRVVKKPDSPNIGRYFWVCSKPRDSQCDYFEWWTDPVAATEQAVMCHCMKPSVVRTVMKDTPNKGKHFRVCSEPREKQCGFFEWVEERSNEPASPHSEDSFSGYSSPGF